MRTPELDAIDDNARKKIIAKSPKALRWLVEMLQEPVSVRQLHLRTKHPKKRLRAALVHLKMLGLVEVNRSWHRDLRRYWLWFIGIGAGLLLLHLHFTGV